MEKLDNIKNIDKIKYTYWHRKIVMFLAQKYVSKEEKEDVLNRVYYHDVDKLLLFPILDKEEVKKIHRETSHHHENDIPKTRLDYIEMILDWESARYTKPDKPFNAYDTLIKFYPNMVDEILPILKEYNLDKSGLEAEKDVLEFASSTANIDEEELLGFYGNFVTAELNDKTNNPKQYLKI